MASNYREYCIYCGKAIQPGSRHCPYCGKKLIEEPQDSPFGKQGTAVPPMPPTPEPRRVPAALIVALAVLLAAAAGTGIWFLRGAGRGREAVIPEETSAESGTGTEAAEPAAEAGEEAAAAAAEEPAPEKEEPAPAETAAADPVHIPEGALEYNGNYYYIYSSDGVRTYAAAKQDCERRGGHLAVITSEELNDRLYRYCRDRGYNTAFFGYNDEQIEGNWVWVTREQPYYTNWGRTEPNADSVRENGALFSTTEKNGTWNDSAFGYETSAYICQWGDNGIADEQPPRDIPADALEYKGHYYYIYEDNVDRWSEAQQWCKGRGGDLAVIEDAGENEALYDYMVREGYEYAFFGYSDAENEGAWKWVSGKNSAFTDWGSDRHGTMEPDDDGNSGQDHAAMSIQMFDGHWDDRKFTSGSPYICEWEPAQ